MIASLNQSSSLSSLGAALMSATTSMAQPSREAAEQQGGVLLLIDAQVDSAQLEDVPFARDQIFNGFDPAARGRRTDFAFAEMKPELPRSGLCQRHGDGHRIVARYRFLDEADDVVVIDLRKAQIAGLQERRIVPPYPVEACDVVFDIARPIPVASLQFILLGVKVFLLSGYRFVLQQLETVVNAVIARQRGGKRHSRLEDPGLPALQMERQDVRRIDEEIGPEIFAFGITGDFAHIGLQLLLARAPSEVGVGLAEAELGERLHHLGSGEGLGQEDDVRIDGLDFSDQPLPERKRLGMRIVDAKDAHPLRDPEQHDVAQRLPKPFVVGSVQVRIDDVLILFWRVFGILDRAVGSAPEPFRMLREPGMVGRALDGKVERDFHAVLRAGAHQAPTILERPKLGVYGVVAALGGADGIWTARIAGFAMERIVAALAVDAADRMDGSQIKYIETHRADVVQSIDTIVKGAVFAGHRRLTAWHHLVPGACPRYSPVDHQRISGAAGQVGLLALAGCCCKLLRQERVRIFGEVRFAADIPDQLSLFAVFEPQLRQ